MDLKLDIKRKILTIGKSLCVTIPKKIIRLKGWKKGDTVRVVLNEKGDLIIKEHRHPKIGDFV